MGVRGLTSFINNRSHLYLKQYQLHDCNVILDGNSIASCLYKWHCKSNDCFSGDYDKFGNAIYNFFELLSQCNITPYVIFDGGYEKRKLATVISRMKNKIRTAHTLNPTLEGIQSVFPLFLREVFVDIVLELGIKLARCDFEGDMEIANIAKLLECPVISYDSDFYIFGCLYIPFSTVELVVKTRKNIFAKISYLDCKIYRIESFVESFGGLNRDNLPLLAVLLGNDYVSGTLFKPFFRNLKIQKCVANQSNQQKRIKSVIVWLQNETVESAIKTVLSRFKSFRRQYILNKIQNAMKGYYEVNSELLEYLEICINIDKPHLNIDFEALKEVELEELSGEDSSDNEENDNRDSDQSDIDNVEFEANDHSEIDNVCDLEISDKCKMNQNSQLSDVFHRNFRKCLYPSCFMDMLKQHKYYCIPQVESTESNFAHEISLDILSSIHKMLCPSFTKCLTVVCRQKKENIIYIKIPPIENQMYSIEEIQYMSTKKRKNILIECLQIDKKIRNSLETLPSEWHLFVISLYYANKKVLLDRALIISQIICFYVLNYVDKIVGFSRSSAGFSKKYSAWLNHKETVTEDDLLKDNMCFMNKLIEYFQMDAKLKCNFKLFDRLLVHSLSQIQSVYLHVKYLNLLLNSPFPNLKIHRIFDGTFMYNMISNLRKRTDMINYLNILLDDSPSILDELQKNIQVIETLLDVPVNQTIKKKKKKKTSKKRKISSSDPIEQNESLESDDGFCDPNNPYSVLINI
ncbi:hypothetical protein GWI33_017560 [Rhynchophorus ferrugineus]|uniref:Protein asteroid n=1 Tax=Rhynchophorus ferrugineus TaxID=354439 RepID=A0A834I1R6_RHYFE|nr:hypothetical protein GWI33_017560 [Rhynchophorus ferrugineus]